MSEEYIFLRRLALNLLFILCLFFLLRILFYNYNAEYFSIPSIGYVFKLALYGLRFDISTIFYCNSLYILLMVFPSKVRFNIYYQKFASLVFFTINLIVLLIEIVDIFYYKYNIRRIIGSDIILFKNAFSHSSTLLFEYGLPILLFIATTIALWKLYKIKNPIIKGIKFNFKIQLILFLITIIIFIIGSRGGLQLRPISPILAYGYVNNTKNAPIVSNAMQNLFLMVQQRTIKPKTYFESSENLNNFKHIHKNKGVVRPYNIVILTLEGIGDEYTGYNRAQKSYTPYLDSLRKCSISFENSFANGQRSTQGITSISSSIPNLMEDPLMFSVYQNNTVLGLPRYLKNLDYNTSFYHGAYAGSMNFDQFTKSIGFDSYNDMTVYPHPEDYDGSWGIWDDKYLQYFANELNRKKQPFMSMVFTLSSHHPYNTEEWFEKENTTMPKTFRAAKYLDYSLKHFFETVQNMDFYKNTIFVISADHIGITFSKSFRTKITKYGIPIIYKGEMLSDTLAHASISSQIDILPSVLDLINYPYTYSCYGHSSFSDLDQHHYTYMLDNGAFQIVDENYILIFRDGADNKTIKLYDYKQDPSLKKDLSDSARLVKSRMLIHLKKVIQTYYNDMLKNSLSE